MAEDAPIQDAAGTASRRVGCARLVFAADAGGQTYLSEQFASYPFHLCRPHRYTGDPPGMATVYLQSLAGGIYQGDRLSVSVSAKQAARAHLTTQASTIVQGMERGHAKQSVVITAARDAIMEYLPDPTILFSKSRLAARLEVNLRPGALVMLSESYLCHDPHAKGRPFDWLSSDITIKGSDYALLARDRFRVCGWDFFAQQFGSSCPAAVQGSFYVITRDGPGTLIVEALKSVFDDHAPLYGGASLLPNDCGAWVRLVATDGAEFRSALFACWSAVRRELFGRTPQQRRK